MSNAATAAAARELQEVRPSLAVELCGLTLASPVVLLSGCVGFGEEYTRVAGFDNRDAGAICLIRRSSLGSAIRRTASARPLAEC